MVSRIVVGVDGSDASQHAVAWCAGVAGSLGADVIAVHAVEEPVYPLPSLAYVAVPPLSEESRSEIRALAEREWCAPLAAAGVQFRVVLADGPPASVLIKVATEEDADLVVTGRRGRGGFAELLLGSTSHQLAHHLGRPLVIVP